MNKILREELGFKGIVESEGDGFGTLVYENIVPTQKEAGALALRAGVDLDVTYEQKRKAMRTCPGRCFAPSDTD
jgi:beta-glucosidase-like glycosyl hydrolase